MKKENFHSKCHCDIESSTKRHVCFPYVEFTIQVSVASVYTFKNSGNKANNKWITSEAHSLFWQENNNCFWLETFQEKKHDVVGREDAASESGQYPCGSVTHDCIVSDPI